MGIPIVSSSCCMFIIRTYKEKQTVFENSFCKINVDFLPGTKKSRIFPLSL